MKVERLDVTGMAGMVVKAEDFDRVEAERDALQALLNERDVEIDRLNPTWRTADEEPPFPFTGEIWLGGATAPRRANWCAGYWRTERGGAFMRSVTHWRELPAVVRPSA